ncbi:substrate-binding domain-containing protein [Nocardioides carbamazepini]|uniref:sugar ABC transporter substrate-binding protein n=1 Tax=Nocardioides carbamazepini TaxID=2854259 RepID=UPI002149E163|nr:substrate-binding domain-containing protein [Nocardioides carbamazepini]MCR1783762.1 substrate-binding domain-containing protein [Nocardioides carbamazepini]
MSSAPRTAGRVAAALSAAGLTAALAACTTPADTASGGTGGDVPQAVTDNVAAHTGPVEASYAGPAFDVSALRGKTVWWVTQYAGNPFLASIGRNLTEALGSVGVEVTTCDGKGNPVDANACIQQGIAQGADAIQVDGPEPATYAESLTAAEKAGIPVLSGAAVDVTTTDLADGLAGQTSQPFGLTGELAADWIVKDSGGKADVLFLTTPDVVGSVSEQEAFEARIEETCPDCSLTVKGVTLANWANDLGTTTSSELVKNPELTYVVPAFDPMTQFTNPAILQAGRSDVKVVTVNGNLPFLQELAKGSSIKAMVGIDLDALAHLEADQLLRAMAGQDTLPDVVAPVRIFDQDNVGDLDLEAAAADDGSWYAGSGAYADLFAGLWEQ